MRRAGLSPRRRTAVSSCSRPNGPPARAAGPRGSSRHLPKSPAPPTARSGADANFSRARSRMPSDPSAMPKRYAPSSQANDAAASIETNANSRYQITSYASAMNPSAAARANPNGKLRTAVGNPTRLVGVSPLITVPPVRPWSTRLATPVTTLTTTATRTVPASPKTRIRYVAAATHASAEPSVLTQYTIPTDSPTLSVSRTKCAASSGSVAPISKVGTSSRPSVVAATIGGEEDAVQVATRSNRRSEMIPNSPIPTRSRRRRPEAADCGTSTACRPQCCRTRGRS